MPLHFPSKKISDLGFQIRERIEIREARRMKKPLNNNKKDLKTSKLRRLSDWAFDVKSPTSTPDRKIEGAEQNVTILLRSSVLAGKQRVNSDDRSSGTSYSPTCASMMSALSSSPNSQKRPVSKDDGIESYRNVHRSSAHDDDDDLIIWPSWDPPDVGPSTWWKYPPPGHNDARTAVEATSLGQHS